MSPTHALSASATAVALLFLAAAPAGALEVPEPMAPLSDVITPPDPVVHSFMGRPGWVTP